MGVVEFGSLWVVPMRFQDEAILQGSSYPRPGEYITRSWMELIRGYLPFFRHLSDGARTLFGLPNPVRRRRF